jgi:hypothetical protein
MKPKRAKLAADAPPRKAALKNESKLLPSGPIRKTA